MAKRSAEVGSTANSYQILGKLATGGMAEIFLARGDSLAGVERYCVLKRILHERQSDVQFIQMFLDEARLLAQLQHPNIASVYDIGILGDSYFFTMEYVHGETVLALLERAHRLRRSVPLACILTIIAGAASGLHHAHERNANDGRPLGIVHRDVSPSNLMVTYEGNIKIVDFGVAKALNRKVETQSGMVKGKISYLSPEQCRGDIVDRRSDLFSLGIVMWEMLTGARLYRRASDFENMTAIVHEAPPSPSQRRPGIPRAIDEIVLRLLAKTANGRFQTAAEVVEAIETASWLAGTILSGSAVSRFVRELFGLRAEPWRGLNHEPSAYQPIMLTLQPLPEEPGLVAIDATDREFERVPDLSSLSMLIEIHDTDPSGVAADPFPAEPAESASAALPVNAVEPPAANAATGSMVPVGTAAPPAQSAIPIAVPSPKSAPIAVHERPSAPIARSGARSAPIAPAPSEARPSQTAIPSALPPLGSAPIAASHLSGATPIAGAAQDPFATTLRASVAPPPVATPPARPSAARMVSRPITSPVRISSAPASNQVGAKVPKSSDLTTSSSATPVPRGSEVRASRVVWWLVAVIIVAAMASVIAGWRHI